MTNEGALADLVAPDDVPKLRSVRWFRSSAHRRAYLEQRGWVEPGGRAPELFAVSGGSGLGRIFELRWNGRELVHERYGGGEDRPPRHVRPEPVDWQRFWRRLDRLDVWAWRLRYEPELMATDGYDWRVRISVAGRSCDSSGYMAFPGERDGWSAVWDAFLLALEDLVGDRPFGGEGSAPG